MDDLTTFTHVYNLEYYTPPLWVALILRFRRTQIFTSGDTEIYFKTIGTRMYVEKVVRSSACTLPVGYAEYWRN